MIVLRKLSAKPADEAYAEPGEHHHHVGVDLGEGRFRVLRLGPSGLTIGDGTKRVAIPRDELFALAEPHLRK